MLDQGPPIGPHFKPNNLCKGPVSKYSYSLRYQPESGEVGGALGTSHVNFKGTQFSP